MAQRWKPNKVWKTQLENGLLCWPKWFAEYDSRIHTWLKGGNQVWKT